MSAPARHRQRHEASTAHARSRVSPAPRRVSGPSARGGAVALPSPRKRGATGTFERVLRLPDHRMADRLLRGRAWIWLVGILLGGIVAMQVSLLKLNTGISRAVEASATLERQNSSLEESIAKLSSGERIRQAAEAKGMIMPPAGEVKYVTVRPGQDAERAVARMRPPTDAARQLMANGGVVPGSLQAAAQGDGATGTAPAAATTQAAPITTTTASPAATAPAAGAAGQTAASGGTAPAGTAPAGTAPAGTAPAGTAPAGTAPDGTATGGAAPPTVDTTAGGTAPQG
jgi:hypothetical protein